jgi:GNAT superfamily N-acetyltransferase
VRRRPSSADRQPGAGWATIGGVETTAVLAGGTDVESLQDVLQAAFWDDPVMTWLFPDDSGRSRRSARLFKLLLERHYLPMHTVWTTSEAAGAALWAPPEHWKIPTVDIVRSLPEFVASFGRWTPRALRFLDCVDRQHPAEPHWYLGVLGTNPPEQGRGVGSALIAPVLERCDRDGVPAYLESSKESNIAFYARHGFELTGEIRAPHGGPVLYPMWRPPVPDRDRPQRSAGSRSAPSPTRPERRVRPTT